MFNTGKRIEKYKKRGYIVDKYNTCCSFTKANESSDHDDDQDHDNNENNNYNHYTVAEYVE